jgi:hypothetical protein
MTFNFTDNKVAELVGYELDDKGLISESGYSLTLHTKFQWALCTTSPPSSLKA